MLQNSNLVEFVRKVNENMSFVLANKDTLELEDLESVSSFLNEYASVVTGIVNKRKVIKAKEEKEKVLKENLYKTIGFYMKGLIDSINRNDIYIENVGYDIDMINEHMGICQGLLISIEQYDSYCKNSENEFLETVSFIEKYLNTLHSILEKESNKNRDLPSMWNFVLSKHRFL